MSSLGTGALRRKLAGKSQVLSLPGTQLTGELEWQHVGRWCRAGNTWLVSGVGYGNVRREDSKIVMVSPITVLLPSRPVCESNHRDTGFVHRRKD